MNLLINIDVDDLAKAEAFYTAAFGLHAGLEPFGRLLGGGEGAAGRLPVPARVLHRPPRGDEAVLRVAVRALAGGVQLQRVQALRHPDELVSRGGPGLLVKERD